MAGLAYLFAAIGISLLLAVGRRESHDARDDSTDVFRYQRAIRVALAFIGPFVGLLGALVYASYGSHPPRGVELVLFVAFFGVWTLANLYGYLHARSFRLEVNDSGLIVQDLRGTREIPFSRIRAIVIQRSIKGGAQMSLRGEGDRKLLSVANTIQDFDSLLWLVRNRVTGPGVIVRERDKWGKWSESNTAR